ncbi:MAG: anti-sigma factor, partial [Verrucomicrobiota bacterium]
MSAEQQRDDQILDFLLGELSSQEREQFENQLQEHPEWSSELLTQDATVSLYLLGQSPRVEPPKGMRERVLAKALSSPGSDEAAAESAVAPHPPQEVSSKSPAPSPLGQSTLKIGTWVVWLIAIAAFLTAGILWMALSITRGELETARMQLRDAGREMAEAAERESSLREKIRVFQEAGTELERYRLAGLHSEKDPYFAIVLWDPDQNAGILRVFNFPLVDQEAQDFQLWVVDETYPLPVDAGVFQVGKDGAADFPFE